MIIDAILSLVTACSLVIGGYLVVYSRNRKLDLSSFYQVHALHNFSDVRVAVEPHSFLTTAFRNLILRASQRLMTSRRMEGPVAKMEVLCELAGLNTTGAIWILQTTFLVALSIPLAIFLAVFIGTTLILLLPVLVAVAQYNSLNRRARKHREKIQQQLPSIISLMGAAAEVMTSLDGSRGILSWICNTVDDDVTRIFRQLQTKAISESRSLEEVFDDASERWNLPELGTLSQTFAIYHEAGRGLKDSFINMANNWRDEQEHNLEASMGRRNFAAIIPLVLFDIPALLIILLAPAAFRIIGDLTH